MKSRIVIWSLGAILLAGGLYAYTATNDESEHTQSSDPNSYCADMKDGQMVVIFEGKEIGADVYLNNGTTVKSDGTLITKDGVRSNLKEGECIGLDGNMVRNDTGKPY